MGHISFDSVFWCIHCILPEMHVTGTLHVLVLLLSAVGAVRGHVQPDDDAALVQVALTMDRTWSGDLSREHLCKGHRCHRHWSNLVGEQSSSCPVFTLAKQAAPKCVATTTTKAKETTAATTTAATTAEAKKTTVAETTAASTTEAK